MNDISIHRLLCQSWQQITKKTQTHRHTQKKTSLKQNEAKRQQELSYRKLIVRQLRTQYVEGIYRPEYYTVTLKCGLEVTQGH